MVTYILVTSLAVQVVVVLLIVRLIRITGRTLPWLALGGAIVLMGVRRAVSLADIWTGTAAPSLNVELIALAISLLLLASVWSLSPILRGLLASQSSLRNSETRYRELTETVRVVPFVQEAMSWRFTFVGTHVESLFGIPEANWRRDGFWEEHVHPDDRAWVLDFCLLNMWFRDDFSLQYRLLAGNDRIVWVHSVVHVERQEREPLRLRGLLIDVSEQRRVEQALRESETRYQNLFENSPVALCEADCSPILRHWEQLRRAGVDPVAHFSSPEAFIDALSRVSVVRVNRRWMSLYELDSVADLAEPEWLFREDSLPAMRELTQALVAGQRACEVEAVHYTHRGQRRIVRLKVAIPTGHERTWDKVYGMVLDVTDSVQAAAERQAAQQSLLKFEQEEKERVEVELARVRGELVRSARLASLGQMAAQIAHDLRNPLGAIRNAAFFLGRRTNDAEAHRSDYVALIRSEIDACDRIIRSLLEATRGREPRRESVELGGLAQRAWGRFRPPPGVTFRCSTEPDPFRLFVDATQFGQVLDNLLGNALDAVGNEGTITVSGQEGLGCQIVTVQDTGPGIAAENRRSVFELFFTTKAQGTGLGLAMCQQIIERHGGLIELANPGERGATFRIRLPRNGE